MDMYLISFCFHSVGFAYDTLFLFRLLKLITFSKHWWSPRRIYQFRCPEPLLYVLRHYEWDNMTDDHDLFPHLFSSLGGVCEIRFRLIEQMILVRQLVYRRINQGVLPALSAPKYCSTVGVLESWNHPMLPWNSDW